MRPDFRKKRFFISVVLLICGVFALYPYLSSNPRRELLKSVSHLDSQTAASVIKTVILGDALIDKGQDLPLTGDAETAVNAMLQQLETSVTTLKTQLGAMPPKSKKLSAPAEEAYKALDKILTDFIVTLAEAQK
ncbi:MAG: hypothetical protein ACOYD9_00825 [Pyramidobacter sp.]